MASTSRKRIGEILCANGSLGQSRLNEALEKQKSGKHRVLGRILMDLGYVTTDQLYDALSVQAKCEESVSD